MAYTVPMPIGGKKPLRATWTYADGTKQGPEDDHTTARLFRRMVENLTGDELRLLDAIVRRRLAAALAAAADPKIVELRQRAENLPQGATP